MTLDETFEVGSDTRTPVDDNDYQLSFCQRSLQTSQQWSK